MITNYPHTWPIHSPTPTNLNRQQTNDVIACSSKLRPIWSRRFCYLVRQQRCHVISVNVLLDLPTQTNQHRVFPANVSHSKLYCVPSRVWTVPSLCSWKFWKIRDDFDVAGNWIRLRRARSNPIARRRRKHLEFFKIFLNIGTELSTLSMGDSIVVAKHRMHGASCDPLDRICDDVWCVLWITFRKVRLYF